MLGVVLANIVALIAMLFVRHRLELVSSSHRTHCELEVFQTEQGSHQSHVKTVCPSKPTCLPSIWGPMIAAHSCWAVPL